MAAIFDFADNTLLKSWTNVRVGETKIGEVLSTVDSMETLAIASSKYVIMGATEDVGVVENGGIAGAATAWESFLKAWLNIQDNGLLPTSKILILGHWHFVEDGSDAQAQIHSLDLQLAEQIQKIVALGKIPILIGGGHNNALGMINGLAAGKGSPINIINLDPHADLRTLEKRHSGNGFSFAIEAGNLNKYFILGLHEAYNNLHILNTIQEKKQIQALFFEDIFMRNRLNWEGAIDQALAFVQDAPYGLELDMDALANTLSSALTPLGISAKEAVRFLYKAGKRASYLHLPEGIYQRADGMEQKTIGKLQAYLVQAFIKGQEEN